MSFPQPIRYIFLISIFLLYVFTSSFSSIIYAEGLAAKKDCKDVELVFARGSGQGLNAGEYARFKDQIIAKVTPMNLEVNPYELGSDPKNLPQYGAVSVDWRKHGNNLIGSEFWWGTWFGSEYRQSVKDGVNEFLNYMHERTAECPNSTFVVGGYSQGAQVIGDALPHLYKGEPEKIAYVALFGDPKLDLPEGADMAKACTGKTEDSPWRRGDAPCTIREGILEGRDPYLPDNFRQKTGSWCSYLDAICTNEHLAYDEPMHSSYAAKGGAVDQAAKEAAEAVAKIADISDLLIKEYDLGFGTTGFDVAIAIDVTASMGHVIAQARRYSTQMAEFVVEAGGRVAVVDFRDEGDVLAQGENAARVRTDFTTDIAHLKYIFAGEYPEGGGDPPEAALSALMTSFNKLSWKRGAVKSVILITDDRYHDPDVATGYTLADITKRALEIDPVNVFPVVPDHLASYYESLASQTSGKVVPYDFDRVESYGLAFKEAVELIPYKPVVLLKNAEYFAKPGDVLGFDVSRSYDPDSTITKYEWDFNADGVIDKTTDTPTTTYVYDSEYDGLAEVRVHSADGGLANGSIIMHIKNNPIGGDAPAAVASFKATSQKTGDKQKISLSWETSQHAKRYKLYANGELVGVTNGPITTATISDVPQNELVVFALVASNDFGDSPQTVAAVVNDTVTPSPVEPEPVQDDTNPGLPEETELLVPTPVSTITLLPTIGISQAAANIFSTVESKNTSAQTLGYTNVAQQNEKSLLTLPATSVAAKPAAEKPWFVGLIVIAVITLAVVTLVKTRTKKTS